jgi:hypothetical protein
MVVIRGRLEPEVGALVLRALEAVGDHLYRTLWRPRQRRRVPSDPPSDGAAEGTPAAGSPPAAAVAPDAPEPDPLPSDFAPTPSTAQLRADALALIAESALHHGLDPGGAGERYQVVVHVDAAVLAEPEQPGQSVLEEGVRIPAETAQHLACDASRVVMRHDPEGRVVEVGARTRTVPPALRRALQHRDGGCRFPGCTSRFTQAHHIRHWAKGGPTTLANLVSLRRFHHTAVHERGFRVERRADGTLGFRWPHGRPLPEVPPPMPMSEDPAATLRERREALGLRFHPRTGLATTWAGDRLDVGYVIDVRLPLAQPPTAATPWDTLRFSEPPFAPPSRRA